MKRLIRLYPKQWRDRYGREFEALLDDVQPTWRAFFDVLKGAISMRLKGWSAWKTVAACGAAGLLAAAIFVANQPKIYVSEAVLKMSVSNVDELSDAANRVESRAYLTQLVVQENLYENERHAMPLEYVLERMKARDIMLAPRPGGNFSVAFTASDPRKAQRVTERLVAAFVEAKAAEMLDPAILPARPVSPLRARILIVGSCSGLLVGVFVALFTGLKVWKLAAGFGVAGLLISVIPWYFVDDVWMSTAVLRVRSGNIGAAQKAMDEITSTPRLEAFAKDWKIDDKWLREHLKISLVGRRPVIIVQYQHKERAKAVQVTMKFASMLIDAAPEAKLEMLDPPSVPLDPFYPNRAMPALLGLLVGFGGAIFVGLRRRRQMALAV